MKDFRKTLQEQGLDLNSQDASPIVSLLTKWADTGVKGSKVLPATYNQKVSIISSFYGYAVTQGWIETNPVETVEKREIFSVHRAKAIEFEKVKAGLKKIRRDTLKGKRDYALLCILLTCGLHVSELTGLRCGDISITDGKVTITYQQKGGIKGEKTLLQATAQAFIEYLTMLYSNGYSATDPVWLSFARNESKGHPIKMAGVSEILEKYLDTSKVESTRFTYLAMKEKFGLTGIEMQLDLI